MNGTADSEDPGATAGLLDFRRGRGSDTQQMSLFDDAIPDDGASGDQNNQRVASEFPTMPAPDGQGPVSPARMRIPDDDSEMQCRTSNPEVWFQERFYPVLTEVCESCPFRQWCANEALGLAASKQYHVVGVWAGVAFTETDTGGVYRRRIQRLEHIARTGADAPRKRRRKKPSVAA